MSLQAVVHGYGKHKTDLTHQEIGAALKVGDSIVDDWIKDR